MALRRFFRRAGARTENPYPRGLALRRLETVVDMLLDTQAAWQEDAVTFRPEPPFFRLALA